MHQNILISTLNFENYIRALFPELHTSALPGPTPSHLEKSDSLAAACPLAPAPGSAMHRPWWNSSGLRTIHSAIGNQARLHNSSLVANGKILGKHV